VQAKTESVKTAPAQTLAPAQTAAAGLTARCSIRSNPTGAEIAIDGKYAGNTPSTIVLSGGNHEVVVSLAGFVSWKRELAVEQGSDLNINASLMKKRP
jgi:hypothetical protein